MKFFLFFLFYFLFIPIILGQESINIDVLKNELKNELVDTTRITLVLKIANLYAKTDTDSSFLYYNHALDLAKKVNSKQHIAQALYKIAANFKNSNQYEKAIKNYLNAASLFEELKNKTKVAYINNYIGYCYMLLYAEDKAIEYYLKSLTGYKSISDEDGVAINYIDIGNLYYGQENYEYAKKYFQDALEIYEKLDDKSGIETCYINLGNAIADEGNYDEGLEFYQKSITLAEELDDQYGISLIYNNIGDCYIEMKQYQKAQEIFSKSLEIAKNLNERELIAVILLNIADLQNKLKNYQSAIRIAKRSLEISKQLGFIEYEIDNFDILTIAYEGIGNKSRALEYLKLYKNKKDSLIDTDKAKKVQLFHALNELERTQFTIDDLSSKNKIAKLKYENEKKISYVLIIAIVIFAFLIILLILQQTSKRKAFNLLEFKNHQINRMNDEIEVQRDSLKQLNKTKDKFFSIIAHDLKSPFNSIKGFTELMIENIHEYDEEKKLKFLKIIKGSTTKASDLLNNLLIWANNQSGNLKYNPLKVELIKQVSDAISLLEIQAINKEINIVNNVENNLFVNADINMFDTILRNLISNAIKFTEPKGEIQIFSSIDKNFVEISVKDNGIGISKSDVKKLFSIDVKNSNIGTANEQGSGLGLILCKDFVERHGGKIWVQSTINKGSEFTFTLPVCVD